MRLSTTPVALLLGGVALTATLAGCSTAADTTEAATSGEGTTESTSEATSQSTPEATSEATPAATDGAYADGEYEATGTYQSPAGEESVDVSLTLAGDKVTAVTVTPNATKEPSVRYQTNFADNVAAEVEGVAIDELAVDKVAGSSLTSDGFNDAVEQIKGEAAA